MEYISYKIKTRANGRVRMALKKGLLVKENCSHCNDSNSIAHHPDYDKPLEVIWLCRKCHHKVHFPAKPSPWELVQLSPKVFAIHFN